AAEPRSMRVERPRPAGDPVAPDVAQQLGLREDAVRLAGQRHEQVVLLLRQAQLALAHPGVPRPEVDVHRGRVDHLGLTRPRPPQYGTDALHELLVLERSSEYEELVE